MTEEEANKKQMAFLEFLRTDAFEETKNFILKNPDIYNIIKFAFMSGVKFGANEMHEALATSKVINKEACDG